MTRTPLLAVAILSVALTSISTRTEAQNVYRCGNSYSQTPCPGGESVDVADPRTPAQKAAADVANRQTARSATEMERSRLREEAAARAANRPTRAASSAPRMLRQDDAGPPKVLRRKPKKKESEYFTAREPVPPKRAASRAR